MPAARRSARPARRTRRAATDPLANLEFRLVGPFRGGRVGAVVGHPTEKLTFYMGSTGGGVWKTADAGRFWTNVSDKYFKRASVGAIAISQSDPNVLYVGMGESCIRENVSHGDGVYKTTDGGRTWTNVGLGNTRNISTVCVDPRDPDTVYVAALGHAHGPNTDRGVFRSRDGGKTWRRVLYRDNKTGAIDLSMDPNNPRILYAALWETVRTPWSLSSGGPGSGIFKTTDGGETWTELTRNPGLPKGTLGKIGVALAPSRPERVYALVEAVDGAVFRSDDGGQSWVKLCEDRNLRQRAWYYMHVFVDPHDADTVWVLNVDQWRSIDAGKTFQQFEVPHGDNHDLWIDPADPQRMVQGNDGGATVTLNGGVTWSTIYNQPTAEMYHVVTDTRFPYRLYGTQQDNTAIAVPSRARIMGINEIEAYDIGGGECGWIAVRPDDPDIVYTGNYQGYLTRYDHRLGQSRNISVWPEPSSGHSAGEVKYRFQWTSPTILSPHDPNILYTGGNHVFRTRDEGQTWERISPDLTRNDPKKLGPSGGPITRDQTGAEYYCTVYTLAESPVQRGLIWAGSDDGLIHVSTDDGKKWRNVTPRGLPAWSTVFSIEASPHDAKTAYAAIDRHMLDDFRPFLFKTTDTGRTWRKITAGIPEDDFCRVVREDKVRPNVLYAGTETGLYVSHDGGARWKRVKANLPAVPIHDIEVREGELVLATHGRSFWALDDITPLRDLSQVKSGEAAHLFPPRPAYRVRSKGGFGGRPIPGRNFRFTDASMLVFEFSEDPRTGDRTERYLDAGKNPPDGAIVQYWLKEKPEDEITLSFHDARGRLIKEFTSRGDRPEAAPPPEAAVPGEGVEPLVPQAGGAADEKKKEPRVKNDAGVNRFVWNLRHADATKIEGDPSMEEFERALAGPQVVPGRYQVRLKVGDQTLTQDLEVRLDPRVPTSQADIQAQSDLLMKIRDKISGTHDAINTIRSVRAQIEDWERRSAADRGFRPVTRQAATLRKRLWAIEEELIQWRAKSRQDTLNWPVKLNGKLGGLAAYVAQADAKPTAAQLELFADLSKRVDAQLAKLKHLMDGDVRRFSSQLRSAKLPPIAPPKAEQRLERKAAAARA